MVRKLVLKFVFLLASFVAFGHPQAAQHLKEIECILGGYGGDDPSFKLLFDATSGGQDKMAAAYYAEFEDIMTKKFNPQTHRLLGHGWPLDGSIPKKYLEVLEKEYGVPREKTIAFWKKYQKEIIKKAMEATELPKKQATAFAGLLWDLHLLGDLTPDNTVIKQVMEIDQILHNMEKHIRVIFKNKPEYADVIMKKLRDVVARCKKEGVSAKVIAQRLIDELIDLRIGARIHRVWKNIKLKWNIDRSINASAKVRARKTAKGGVSDRPGKKFRQKGKSARTNKKETISGFKDRSASNANAKTVVTKSGQDVTETTVEKTAKKAGVKSAKKSKGLLQRIFRVDGSECYILSVHVSENALAGLSAGVLTFIISEGVSVVGFAKGDISEEEFLVESAKNAGAAIVDGLAVYVTCCMGFGPTGLVAFAIGAGAYIIYDFVFSSLYDINKAKSISIDDYLGVMPTSIQRRKGAFEYEGPGYALLFTGNQEGVDYKGRKQGIEYHGRNPGLGEVPTRRKDGFGL